MVRQSNQLNLTRSNTARKKLPAKTFSQKVRIKIPNIQIVEAKRQREVAGKLADSRFQAFLYF